MLSAVTGLLACNSAPKAPPPLNPQQESGRRVFQTNCAICHQAYKKEPLQGPSLVGVFRKHDLPSGIPATDDHVRETIRSGRRNMPPFDALLDQKQIDDLLAFLHTL